MTHLEYWLRTILSRGASGRVPKGWSNKEASPSLVLQCFATMPLNHIRRSTVSSDGQIIHARCQRLFSSEIFFPPSVSLNVIVHFPAIDIRRLMN